MNVSLRKRLFWWLSLSILVAGLLAGALSFGLTYRDANELQDAQLLQVASILARQPLPAEPIRFTPRDSEDAETHYVIKRLGSTRTDPNPKVDLALPATLAPGLQTLEQAGVRWRAIVFRHSSGERSAVAQRMMVRDEVARDAALLTLLPLVLLVPVLLLIVAFVLRQGFAPLTAMSAEVDRRQGNQLETLEERVVPLEALPLVQAVNRMMRRLSLALEQQRRLVSDAAHELRTPVAILTVQASNVSHLALPPAARERMAALQRGLVRMSSMIDQLLDFARVQGTAAVTDQRLDLAALVRSAVEQSLPLAQARGVDLGCLRLEPVDVVGDAMHAFALVRNAIDNAVRYTPCGGAVDVSVSRIDRCACVVVEDTGPGITPADLERVFEPFVRVLGSDESGSGLGLAIARTASQALGGKIELGARTDHPSGLRFVYRQAAA